GLALLVRNRRNPGRLIDHHDVGVLEDDVDGWGAAGLLGPSGPRIQRHLEAALKAARRIELACCVDRDLARADELANVIPRGAGAEAASKRGGERRVRVFARRREAETLRGRLHRLGRSWCSPKTPRSTSAISPTVARARTASRIRGRRFSVPRAAL